MMHVTDRRALGNSGLEVPAIGFGGAPLGNLFQEFSDSQARDTVRAAYDAGMRLFDTASPEKIGFLFQYFLGDFNVLINPNEKSAIGHEALKVPAV